MPCGRPFTYRATTIPLTYVTHNCKYVQKLNKQFPWQGGKISLSKHYFFRCFLQPHISGFFVHVLPFYSFISQLSDRQSAKGKDPPAEVKDVLCWVAFIIYLLFSFFLWLRCCGLRACAPLGAGSALLSAWFYTAIATMQ